MDQIKRRVASLSLVVLIGCTFCIGYHCGSGESIVSLKMEHEFILLFTSCVLFLSAVDMYESDKYI
jgi:hypothetical protein